jgi:cache domain-containing protein
MMVKGRGLMALPFMFLIIGITVTMFISIPGINALSLMKEKQNSNNTSQSQLSATTNFTLLKQLNLYTLYHRLNNTISDLMAIANASSNGSNSFGNLPLVNVTNEMKLKYHGLPSDQDLEKRNEARKLLATNKALLYIGLLLPNGDRYFGEPYSPYQTNGPTINFAYRNHFIGAVETKQPYLSNTLNAVSTGEPLAILANPIYSDSKNHNSLIGVQVLGLNYTYFNDLIKSAMMPEDGNKRFIIIDNNGTEIGDSSYNNYNMESFKDLQSFQNAKNGESGFLIEKINGKNMYISYTPIKFAQTNWIILLLSTID